MMADINTSTWSETAASNNAAAPDGAPEGMSYASVNDVIREGMAATKRDWNRRNATQATGGTSSALTLTYTTAPTAYTGGHIYSASITTTNAANATLNINALGARKIYVPYPAGPVQVLAGNLTAGNVYSFAYLTSLDSGTGGFLVLNPTARGAVIDRGYAEYTAFTGLGTVIPIDDTIPQVGEGTEILSVAITPKSTTSRLRVRFQGSASSNAGSNWLIVAAFVNGAANAVASTAVNQVTAGAQTDLTLEHEYVPGSTSAQTISIRAGAAGGSIAFNGNLAVPTRYLGGTQKATLIVEEIAV
jgi:hypothetical protein